MVLKLPDEIFLIRQFHTAKRYSYQGGINIKNNFSFRKIGLTKNNPDVVVIFIIWFQHWNINCWYMVYLLINMQSSHKYSSASRREVVEWPKEPNFLDKRILLHHLFGVLASLSVPSHCTTFSSSSALRPSCWSRRWCSRTPRTPRRPPPARSHHRLPRDRHQSEPSCSPRQPWPACSLFPGQLPSQPGCIFHRSFARREASTSGALSWLALGEDIRSNLCQDMSHRGDLLVLLLQDDLICRGRVDTECHQLSCNEFVMFKHCI